MTEASGVIHFATYKEIVVTVNGVETERVYMLAENIMSYKSVTNLCSMPTNFLFNLIQESENPNYVMEVIDLLLQDTDLVVMIQDQMNIETYTNIETYYDVEKTVDADYKKGHYDKPDKCIHTETEYEFPSGSPETITTITTTYTNTAEVFIQNAKTWCLDFAQEASPNHTLEEGEHVETKNEDLDFGGLDYTFSSSSRGSSSRGDYSITSIYISSEPLLYSTEEWTDIENFGWNINITQEKRINYERFLGLWKNDRGECYPDCQYDENGKLVGYPLPEEPDALAYPVKDMSSLSNGQNIDELIELLASHYDTQTQELLMMYYWNIYYGEDKYEVDIDAILSLFDVEAFVQLGGYGQGAWGANRIWWWYWI